MSEEEFDSNYKVTISHANMELLFNGIKERDKEIERLTKQNKALNEVYELTKKEYIRLNNIIKEAIEYIENHFLYHYGSDKKPIVFEDNYIQEIVDILDKGSE